MLFFHHTLSSCNLKEGKTFGKNERYMGKGWLNIPWTNHSDEWFEKKIKSN